MAFLSSSSPGGLALLLALPFCAAACGTHSDAPPIEALNGARPSNPGSGALPLPGTPQHIYVADARIGDAPGRLVQFEDLRGAAWTTWTGGPTPLSWICGVAVDTQGRIYLGGGSAAEILRLDDPSGGGLVTFGPEGQFANVRGVAVDAKGRIYAVDGALDLLIRIDDMSGTNRTTFGWPGGSFEAGGFNQPSGVAVSASGKILVGDLGNHRIVEMNDMSGAGWTTWELPMADGGIPPQPYGVAFDDQERIYVVDQQSSTLYRMNNIHGDGLVSFAHDGLTQMSHVFVHSSGRIFLTMLNGTSRVAMMMDMTGAGLQTFGSKGDGTNQFSNPCGIVAR
jgi:DNA-binding beta-propeller fold protein YncE